MDKISGIVPSTSRITSVDLRDAHPVRPGTPLFGRPEGKSTRPSQNTINGGHPPSFDPKDTFYSNPIDSRNSGIANRIAERFFGQNKVDAAPLTEEIPNENEESYSLNNNVNSDDENIQESNDGKSPQETIDEKMYVYNDSIEEENPDSRVMDSPSEIELEYNKGQYLNRFI